MSVQMLVTLSHFHVIAVSIIAMLSTRVPTRYPLVSIPKLRNVFICYCTNLERFFSGDLEITMEFLLEIDKLVQLIESPIFAGRSHIYFNFVNQ